MTATGGSNYNWTAVEGCNREPHGVLKNFDSPSIKERVAVQLQSMFDSGQRRLRIMIYHGRNSTGTVLVPDDDVEGLLEDLLLHIKNAGFQEIMVAMGPVGENRPSHQIIDEIYQENWTMVQRVRDVVTASGIHYRMDLQNEGIVPNGHPRWDYCRRLWIDYVEKYGKGDTVGFSIPVDWRIENRINTMDGIYSNDFPFVFSAHFYGYMSDEFNEFVILDRLMKGHGHGQGWIIGESYYNDKSAAAGLKRAIETTDRTVFYLTQWPMKRAGLCRHVDAAPPVEFGEFIEKGF